MGNELTIRGITITTEVLEQIRHVVSERWEQGRKAISKEICQLWDWRQDNGYLKDQVCRILLRRLEDKGLISLPAPKRGITNPVGRRYYVPPEPPPAICQDPIEGSFKELPNIRLHMVRGTSEEPLWNYLVYRFHYKSYRIIVGAHLKYIAYLEDRPIACLAYSSSVFRIRCRDEYIGWDREARSKNIAYIANNSRFLILPWVRVTNLASHVLSRSAKALPGDWLSFYGRPVHLLETFVDNSRFAGTCYKAANWSRVGQTKGHAKKKNRFYYHGRSKEVYLYPLTPDFRNRLIADKPRGGAL
jgi:hypothetical protein